MLDVLRAGSVAVCTAAVLATAGCGAVPGLGGGDERSTEAFCQTYWDQKEEYLDKYESRSDLTDQVGDEDPFAGALVAIGSSFEAMGDVVIIFQHLADHAPDDIRPDVEALRDAFKKNIDDAGDHATDPLAGLASGLVTGLTTMGSWQRVGDYVVDNCGEQG